MGAATHIEVYTSDIPDSARFRFLLAFRDSIDTAYIHLCQFSSIAIWYGPDQVRRFARAAVSSAMPCCMQTEAVQSPLLALHAATPIEGGVVQRYHRCHDICCMLAPALAQASKVCAFMRTIAAALDAACTSSLVCRRNLSIAVRHESATELDDTGDDAHAYVREVSGSSPRPKTGTLCATARQTRDD
jgi:hypothetical protein